MDTRPVERQRFRVPAVEIRENKAAVVLQAEMPGVDKRDFDIKIDGDELTIRGRRKPQESELKMIHEETDKAEYMRTFLLGEELDPANVEARVDSGVLTVTLHKKKEAAPQKIAVQQA